MQIKEFVTGVPKEYKDKSEIIVTSNLITKINRVYKKIDGYRIEMLAHFSGNKE